jgi:hypothetical protein
MARNNRMELIERVAARGTRILTEARVIDASGPALELEGADGATTKVDIGEFLIIAIGPASDKDASRACEDAGVPYALVGDANKPGDFLTCLRDAWMVALSVDHRFRDSVGNETAAGSYSERNASKPTDPSHRQLRLP